MVKALYFTILNGIFEMISVDKTLLKLYTESEPEGFTSFSVLSFQKVRQAKLTDFCLCTSIIVF